MEELWEKVEIGHKGRLQDDGDVWVVEKFDWEVLLRTASGSGAFDGKVHPESLDVYDDQKHDDRCEEVGNVWKIGAVERFSESSHFVGPRNQ